ncbi:helix-turn-helix domain-containing protein [Cetobacterium sp. 8H]|uniref:LexA family protein n=1 Tax=Cetobacterium sp. 8H TaxID=2759681 RepID=UPI00163C3D54|nr:XRE family transcriptional regulator [Cetobacterium sp. 8H]MBC2850287.1 helix-turn-helix domain-containing protein [Cetobacterium sp. 8H]
MNILGIVVKKLREEKGYTQLELAKKANIGSGTLGDIESGRNKSTVKTLNKIAEALNLNKEEKNKLDEAFLGREIKKESLMEQLKDPIQMMVIPVYSSVAAGMGYIPDAEPVDFITIPETSGECIGIKVQGDSMEPTFFSGDIVVLKKEVEVGLGEIGVFMNKTSGESLVKRLKKKNGVFVLESDNHIFRDIEIKSDEICCCGKVINVVKKDLKKRVNPLQELLDDIPADKLALAEKLLKTLIPDEDKK